MQNPIRSLEKKIGWDPRADVAAVSRSTEAKVMGIIAVMCGGIILGTTALIAENAAYSVQNLATTPNPFDGRVDHVVLAGVETGVASFDAAAAVLGVAAGVELASLSVLGFRRAQELNAQNGDSISFQS